VTRDAGVQKERAGRRREPLLFVLWCCFSPWVFFVCVPIVSGEEVRKVMGRGGAEGDARRRLGRRGRRLRPAPTPALCGIRGYPGARVQQRRRGLRLAGVVGQRRAFLPVCGATGVTRTAHRPTSRRGR